MSTYDQIYSAIMMYYDSSSDIYQKVTSGQGLTVGEMNAVLSSVPYMQPVTAIDGTRLGVDAPVTFKDPSKLEFIVGPDSNIPNSEYGSGFNANVPGSSSYDAGSGTFSLEAGARDSSNNILPVIADKISLAVTGVNIGAKLGLEIDKVLYENAPDFWRTVFGNVSPYDFERLFSEDTLGNKFVRMLFGIRDTGMTAYVQEEIIAATYQALRDAGVFASDNVVPAPLPSQDESFVIDGESIVSTISRNYGEWSSGYNNPFDRWGFTMGAFISELQSKASQLGIDLSQYTGLFTSEQVSGSGSAIHKGCLGQRTGIRSDSEGTYILYRVTQGVGSPLYIQFSLSYQYDSTTSTGYREYASISSSTYSPQYYTTPINVRVDQYNRKTTRTSGIRMTVSSGVPGSSKLPETAAPYGTPDPSIIDGTDVSTILSQLKQNYPDLFTDPITVNVPQEDGSTKTITYVPVPWPDGVTKNQPNPVTQPLPRPSTQPQPHPTTQTDVLIQDEPTIEDLIDYNTDPLEQPKVEPQEIPQPVDTPAPMPQPTPTPQPNPDPDVPSPTVTPPDTGDGETPPSVAPIGNASSLWAVYNPTQGEVNAFGAWLWSDDFIDNLKRLFVSPMDGIIGIHKIYCTPPRGGSAPITVGYLQSDVSAITVPSQYKVVECGEVEVREQFGNVFDYEPYTKISCYLPFIGIVKLNTSDVMRSTVTINYTVDVYTGACYAEILCKRDGFENVLYTFAGDSASHYPISSGSYSGIISGIVSAGAAAIAAGATMGVGAGILAGGTSLLTRNNRLTVQHSGGFSGNASVMGGKKPYLIIERPQVKLAESYPDYDGVPSNTTIAIGACKGYVKCKEVHLTIAGAYQAELDEIETLLKEGILI